MDFDLTRGLRDLSDQPTVPDEVVRVPAVLSRVRRARALRTAGVGAASVAAVVALAVAVQASPFRDEPAPPADPTPTVEPTPSVEPTPRPTATPTPTAPPVEEPDEPVAAGPAVALTDDGRLVTLDPATGAEVRQVATGLTIGAWDGLLAVSPDGAHAYVVDGALPGDGEPPTIQRITLADGAAQDVAQGWSPAVSPDGSTLAFLAARPGDDPYTSLGLNLLDLAEGSVRYLPDDEWCECERVVTTPAWSPDGTQIAIGVGWGGLLSDVDVVVVDLATAQTLGDARRLATTPDPAAPEGEMRLITRLSQAYLPDGRLVIGSRVQGADALASEWAWDAGALLEVVDPSTGAVLVTHDLPPGSPEALAVAPDGSAVLVALGAWTEGASTTGRLLRWEPGAGVGELATGFRAVAW